MKHIKNIIAGIFIGAGAILPGISSGVFCVIFEIYDKLINSILNLKNNFRKNIIFLIPIFIGFGIGVLLFGNILKYLFLTFPVQINTIIIGFILGSIPKLFESANKKNKFRLHYLLYTFLALAISIILLKLENVSSIDSFYTQYNVLFLILSGFLMSIGIVFPGVSSTAILMILGVYSIYLNAVANINIRILIPMGIGIVSGSLIFMKIIQYLFNKYYSQTYYSIIGFVIASIVVLLNNINFENFNFTVPICIIISYLIAIKLSDIKIEG